MPPRTKQEDERRSDSQKRAECPGTKETEVNQKRNLRHDVRWKRQRTPRQGSSIYTRWAQRKQWRKGTQRRRQNETQELQEIGNDHEEPSDGRSESSETKEHLTSRIGIPGTSDNEGRNNRDPFKDVMSNVKNRRDNDTFTSVRLRNWTGDSAGGKAQSNSRRCGNETAVQVDAERRQGQ